MVKNKNKNVIYVSLAGLWVNKKETDQMKYLKQAKQESRASLSKTTPISSPPQPLLNDACKIDNLFGKAKHSLYFLRPFSRAKSPPSRFD